MRRVVVDTSVLAAVAFGEPDGERWAGRLDGCALYAPTLLQYELASVARKKCRQYPDQAPQIVRAIVLALEASRGLTLIDPNPSDVVVMANATGLTAYDASFLWLAGFLEADLVTRDRALSAALEPFAGSSGVSR
jgi:predicted nucleic acid-binding protein